MTPPPQPDVAAAAESLIRSRRSVRHFSDQPVPRATIEALIEVAAWAPSGGNEQPLAVTALDPDAARTLFAKYERRGWNALLPKIAGLVARARGLTLEQATDGARRKIETEGVVNGAPWLLLVDVGDDAGEPLVTADVADGANQHDVARMLGPVNTGVVTAGAVCFAYALMLAAEARQLATCMQHSWLAFEAEIGRDVGLPPGRRLATAVLVGPRRSRARRWTGSSCSSATRSSGS